MTDRDYFFLGCKLFGVYCLVLGFPYVLAIIPTIFSPQDLGWEYERILLAAKIATWLIPIVYITGGFYLIKDGRFLYQLAYSGGIETKPDLEGKLTLFVKMLGIFLIVTYFPSLLRTISNFIVYTNAPKYYEMFAQRQFTYLNAASSIGAVIFGIYLLKGGKTLIRMCLSGLKRTN